MDLDEKIRQHLRDGTLQQAYATSEQKIGGGIGKQCPACGALISPESSSTTAGLSANSGGTHWLHEACHDRWLVLRHEVNPEDA